MRRYCPRACSSHKDYHTLCKIAELQKRRPQDSPFCSHKHHANVIVLDPNSGGAHELATFVVGDDKGNFRRNNVAKMTIFQLMSKVPGILVGGPIKGHEVLILFCTCRSSGNVCVCRFNQYVAWTADNDGNMLVYSLQPLLFVNVGCHRNAERSRLTRAQLLHIRA